MTAITHRKKRNTHHSLRKQLQSEYFNSTSIKFLNEFSIYEGTLLFFYNIGTPLSLGAALLSKKDQKYYYGKEAN